MNHSPKLAILQSLDAMNSMQAEQVLDYIKGLAGKESSYQNFRNEAMKEIRKALRTEKKVAAHA